MAFAAFRIALLAALVATPALAQPGEDGSVALSPAERTAAIDSASRLPDDGIEGAPINGRRAHGEVGFQIGSNGERAMFGSTVVPLGQTGYAGFSFLTGQSGRWRSR